MHVLWFGDGAKGMATQQSVNETFGVHCFAQRESRNHPFVEVWTCPLITGEQMFDSYLDLFNAVNAQPTH